MKPLIIVESFTKTKTISKYLDNEYDVICSLGHFKDLPKNELGINTITWEGTYIITNKKILDNMRKYIKKTNLIYIATDPDMEGEAIAHHIKVSIKDLLSKKKCYRIKFHEITKKSIIDAINNPLNIDDNIVKAQETRRFLDRLIGYKMSPLLWQKFNIKTLSVGRVQTVALSMCIDMLNNIQNHNIEQYWIITCLTDTKCSFKLYDNKDQIVKKDNKEDVYDILNLLHFNSKFSISFEERNSTENPKPPYTTTSLQQDAYNTFHFVSKKTMILAQQLYENGYITYIRTDSTNISNDFKNKIIQYVNDTYGENYSQFRTYKNKILNAQEAHEAIRITNINVSTTSLTEEHNKLYSLIWKRTISCQMINAEYINLAVEIKLDIDYKFINEKKLLINNGYLCVYNIKLDNIEEQKKMYDNCNFIEFKGTPLINQAPTLYNEISLIKNLEKEGIGRPSTYTSIIDKLFVKKYVIKDKHPQIRITSCDIVKTKRSIREKENIITIGGKSNDYLIPTEIGIKIISYLTFITPFILDKHFTANMENTLDEICFKKKNKFNVLEDFYKNYIVPYC